MPETYYFGAYLQVPFCWAYLPDQRILLEDQSPIESLDQDALLLVDCLLSTFPMRPGSDMIKKTLEAINIGPRDGAHASRKKNYLINRLDRSLQIKLGQQPPSLESFKASDRRLIDFTRNQPPQFLEEVLFQSLRPANLSEWLLLHWHLLCLGQNRAAANIQKKIQSLDKGLMVQIINDAQRLQLHQELSHLDLERLKSSQFKQLLIWLNQMLLIAEQSALSAGGTYLVLKAKAMLASSLQIFLKLNPHLTYLKQEILTARPALDADHLMLLFAEQVIGLEAIQTHPFSLSREQNNLTLHQKFSFNYLDKPCQEPDWNKLLITPQEICEIERQAQEIWILTSHFLFDNNIPWLAFTEMYCQNMLNKKQYVYFYPPELEHQARSMLERCYFLFGNNVPRFLSCPQLKLIFKFISGELVIYDPQDIDSPMRQGYFLDVFDSMAAYHAPEDSFATVHQRIPERNLTEITRWCRQQMIEQDNHA